jgi:hypothetical protein
MRRVVPVSHRSVDVAQQIPAYNAFHMSYVSCESLSLPLPVRSSRSYPLRPSPPDALCVRQQFPQHHALSPRSSKVENGRVRGKYAYSNQGKRHKGDPKRQLCPSSIVEERDRRLRPFLVLRPRPALLT